MESSQPLIVFCDYSNSLRISSRGTFMEEAIKEILKKQRDYLIVLYSSKKNFPYRLIQKEFENIDEYIVFNEELKRQRDSDWFNYSPLHQSVKTVMKRENEATSGSVFFILSCSGTNKEDLSKTRDLLEKKGYSNINVLCLSEHVENEAKKLSEKVTRISLVSDIKKAIKKSKELTETTVEFFDV